MGGREAFWTARWPALGGTDVRSWMWRRMSARRPPVPEPARSSPHHPGGLGSGPSRSAGSVDGGTHSSQTRKDLGCRAFVIVDAEPLSDEKAYLGRAPRSRSPSVRVLVQQRGEFGHLCVREAGGRPGRPTVLKPVEALGVIAAYPVPQRLAVHRAGLRRALAINAFENEGDGEHAPGRSGVARLGGRFPQLPGIEVEPGDSNGRHASEAGTAHGRKKNPAGRMRPGRGAAGDGPRRTRTGGIRPSSHAWPPWRVR